MRVTVVEFADGQDGRVYVDVPDQATDNGGSGLVRAGAGDRIARAAADTWHGALAGVRSAAEGALAQLRAIEPPPEEVEVTFGVAVDGKLGATLVSAGSNAHLNVRVVWRNTAGTTTGPDPAP
jgi:NTP-dependent ternary system trypsin peptidase co-occuring protein